ncbi:MAG: tyrosine-type recombinase/integrase [Solirubrobacterales bacterium]
MSETSVVVVGGRAAALSSLRSLRVALPSGEAYWTVVDEEYRVVAAADAFLRDLRFGADRTESTTKLYAGELALFLGWADGSGRDLERAARELSRFVLLLRTTPITRRGTGYGRPRGAGRINHVLAVVREFVKHRVAHRQLDARVLAALYEVGDDRFLPAELRAEDGGLRYRVRPRHKLRAGRPGRGRAARQEEWEALLLAAGSWRDRFLLVLLWFSGLRIGEALGLRRSDLHLMESATELGCGVAGAHLHVVPRENVNGARAKGRRERVVPLAHHVLSYHDLYLDERERCTAAGDCDFVLVNLFAAPFGAPMRYSRVAQLFRSLSRRAELARRVTPHMLRHAAGTELTAHGGLEVAQAVLGHASITSTEIYVHPSLERQREAVERLARAPRPGPAPGEPR